MYMYALAVILCTEAQGVYVFLKETNIKDVVIICNENRFQEIFFKIAVTMREVPWKLMLVLLWCYLLTSSCTLLAAPRCFLQATLPKKLLKPRESSAWLVGKAEGKSVTPHRGAAALDSAGDHE